MAGWASAIRNQVTEPFFSEVAFGRTYDHTIKLALRSGKSADDAMLAPGLVEDLREIEDKRQQEQKLAQPAEAEQGTSSAQDQDQEDADMDDISFRLPPTGDSNEPELFMASYNKALPAWLMRTPTDRSLLRRRVAGSRGYCTMRAWVPTWMTSHDY